MGVGIEISDGTGSGFQAKVDSLNQIQVRSTSVSEEHDTNLRGGSANLVFEQTPSGANDCFIYIKNTGTVNLCIEGITLFAASSEVIEVYLNDTGDPSGGTDLDPVNLNTGFTQTPTGVFQVGNNITGLTQANRVFRLRFAGTSSEHYNFEADLILRKGGVMTVYAVNGSIALEGHVPFYEVPEGT